MALADSQKISRVLPGQPFGDGRDGSLTISSNTTNVYDEKGCSGSSGTTTLTISSAGYSNEDVLLIHQSRGTGAGNWEINKIESGGGTTSLTMSENLANTYTDSGDSQAQCIRFKQYTDVTVEGGNTLSGKDWTGGSRGFLIFACNGDGIVNGALNVDNNGFDGSTSRSGDSSAGGTCVGGPNYQGKGTGGSPSATRSANGNGGGGGLAEGANSSRNASGGGGGGNGTSGTQVNQAGESPGNGCSAQLGGAGGGSVGSAELTTMTFGGAGGNGGQGHAGSDDAGYGGDGAGIIFVFSKTFDCSSGTISLNGENGTTDNAGGGGGGAGGSLFVGGKTIDLGSSVITADGGTGGAQTPYGGGGGAGGDGRIAVHYSGSVTGTTSPTLNSTEDSTLVELGLYPQTMVF